ncbi:hypothetical protein BH10ACI1_BH10ACI1_05180 [soil metagenome]
MAKHEKSFVNFDKPYEQNIIGLRGIIIFAVGLFLLIVITFALMWVLEVQLENRANEIDKKDNQNPMALTDKENLPPEPRLQGAPGFGVDGPNGRINLELVEPHAEYRELHKIWEKEWEEGQKNQQTGTVVTLPIEEAKKKFLEQNSSVKVDENTQKLFEESQTFVSYSSAGRTRTDRRR